MDSSDSTMESSQVVVQGAEGCRNSSESGWTAYIGSPTSENESLSDEDARKQKEFSGGEEDDSMASDASSGPSDRHKNDVVEDHTSPRTNYNGKQVRRRSMQREERRRRSRDKSPQEQLVISNAATGFSRVRGVRKQKLG